MKIELDGLGVRGISIGGIENCLEVPSWKLAFDLGRCCGTTVGCRTVLFTHGHIDHMGGVASHVARRALRQASPPTYVVPRPYEAGFLAMLEAWRRLDGTDLPCDVVAMEPEQELRLREDQVVRAFQCPHRAPCLGYHVFSERRKLVDELALASPEEIKRRRKAGETVTRIERASELAFCGDTSFELIEAEEQLHGARRLMLECTFLDDRVSAESAAGMGHVHLDDIARGAELLRGVESLTLMHVSARYSRNEALSIVKSKLPAWLWEKTHLFVD